MLPHISPGYLWATTSSQVAAICICGCIALQASYRVVAAGANSCKIVLLLHSSSAKLQGAHAVQSSSRLLAASSGSPCWPLHWLLCICPTWLPNVRRASQLQAGGSDTWLLPTHILGTDGTCLPSCSCTCVQISFKVLTALCQQAGKVSTAAAGTIPAMWDSFTNLVQLLIENNQLMSVNPCCI